MTLETPYFIASVTKPYVAAVVLRLAERGRIGLDHPIASYLPRGLVDRLHVRAGVDRTSEITVHHLLSHRSGLADYLEDRPRNGPPLIDRLMRGEDREVGIEEVCDIVRRDLAPHFAPRSPASGRPARGRYSDTNFRLLMAMVETIAGHAWPEVLARELLEPLELRRTWAGSGEPIAPGPPPAALWHGDQTLRRPRLLASLGDLYSTVSDQIAFMRALATGRAFRDAKTGGSMGRQWHPLGFDPTTPRLPGWPIEYGLGIMRFVLPRWLTPFHPMPPVVGHTGSTGCWLFHCPELDVHLCGTVSQVTAGAVPFRIVPRVLRIVRAHVRTSGSGRRQVPPPTEGTA